MIDVMFFLLATFMLASLSMQNLHSLPVNLPEGSASLSQPRAPVTLTVTREDRIYIDKKPVTLETLARVLKPMLGPEDRSVIVAADESAHDGTVVRAMLAARRAGARHFLLAVRKK